MRWGGDREDGRTSKLLGTSGRQCCDREKQGWGGLRRGSFGNGEGPGVSEYKKRGGASENLQGSSRRNNIKQRKKRSQSHLLPMWDTTSLNREGKQQVVREVT